MKRMIRLMNHIQWQFKAFGRYGILLLLLLTTGSVVSCLDSTLLSSSGNMEMETNDADIYMSINVPRAYASEDAYDKETEVETLDVLVFAKGETDTQHYFVRAACKGTLTDANTFQVVMPVGKNFLIHVFINCHEDMVAKNFYNSTGMEMETLLTKLTTGIKVNSAQSLPMHGYMTGVNIDKTVNTIIPVPVLRTVAAAEVVTKLSSDGITPGIVTDENGKPNFELREAYLYFYPDSGRVAPTKDAYIAIDPPGGTDETRDVKEVSLSENHKVSDTRQNENGKPKPDSIISKTAVDRLATFYLYENKPWSETGVDWPPINNKPVATTRLVVGGVYNGDTDENNEPKVTYYRVDFPDKDNKLTEILRNHKYTFSIEKVSGPGYETPDEAALGVPVNIYVQVIEWTNELEHVDFDRQNYFYSSTKYVEMPREANSVRNITVKSDVPVNEWEMSFETETNGTAVTANGGYIISNDRYKVEKANDGKSLVFTVLKAYADLTGGESRQEVLKVKARELNIVYNITQVDKASEDWGNGGDLPTELGK